MIQVKNLWKKYHGEVENEWVLQDLNFTIPKGVSVGLVGSNGAGKSTLLNLIAGIDTPEKGEVIRDCSVSWPIGLSGGFQMAMTGRQNVMFVARVHGGDKRIDEIVKFVEEFAEIGKAFDRPVRTYSSGMKSRLRFGMSLAIDFDVYLSDEATAVGDKLFKEKASNAFKERVGQSSLIMVSHQEGILKELCQSGIMLHNKQAVWYEDINEALEVYNKMNKK